MPNRQQYQEHKKDIDRRREEFDQYRQGDEYRNLRGSKKEATDRYADALEELSQAAQDLDRED